MTDTTQLTAAERELADLLIQALNLEGRHADEFAPSAPLFDQRDGGWGLDSIDALEIALAIQQRYGVEISAEDPQTKQAFSCIRMLNQFVQRRRATAGA